MTCGFTGHRPEKLPWGNDETDERCAAVKVLLEQAVRTQIFQGVDTFLCGMARGADLYFAEAVLNAKTEHPHIRLEAWLPCPEQALRWSRENRQRQRELLSCCDMVYILEKEYTRGCMLRRNRAMVRHSDRLISLWDGSSGGTKATVCCAKAVGIPVFPVWL